MPDVDPLEARCAAHAPVVESGRFTPGTVFGDWRITAFIGRGGNGEAYCAEHVLLGTAAAVKVLMRDEPRAKERFAREAKLLSELKSTAFPQFLAYGEANGSSYLAMELLEPGELPTGDRRIAKFLLHVCDGVAELHARGIVHRDIKPGNILWRKGAPVLADLGLAKKCSNSDESTSPRAPAPLQEPSLTIGGVGTPGYGAPEQMERGEASPASDIHALGVLADRCFEGNPPRAWKRIIERATSSIPAHRYSSVIAFARAIRLRHWGRLMLCLAIPLLVAVVILSGNSRHPEMSEDKGKESEQERPFKLSSITRLNGGELVLQKPIVLEAGKEYRVVGPGTLDVDIFCPTTAVLRLKDCVLLNRTKRLYPENGIQYRLENGVYLNFINIRKKPLGLRVRDFTGLFDGAYNKVRFGGPATVKELMELIEEEQQNDINKWLNDSRQNAY